MKDIRGKIIIGALLGVAVVVGLLVYTDLQRVAGFVRQFPPHFIVPIVGFTLLNYTLRWFKWHIYLRLIGVRSLPVLDSIALFVAGFVLALSPGKVAELLKAAILRSMTGTPVARSAPVIIAERVTDGLGMMILAAIGFGGMLVQAASANEVLLDYLPAYFVVLAILLTGVVATQIRPLALWGLGLVERLPLVGRVSHSLKELYESSYGLFRPGPLLFAVGLGVISWAGECIAFFFILWGLGLEPSWLLLWQAMFILASSSIIGAISGLPGGLGAVEFGIVSMIQVLVLHDSGFAGTAAFLVRLFTLWFAATLGLISATVFRRRLFPERAEQLWRAAISEPDPSSVK